jgi:dihydrofolate reductase
MSISLDGFIAGPNDKPGNPGGDGFIRLHEWGIEPAGAGAQLMDDINTTGAVLTGRRTAEQAGHWRGLHHGVDIPIFVLSHRPPDPSVAEYPLVTYLNDDLETAMATAMAAAGEHDLLVHGGNLATQALEAGILDEVQIHQVPVLFGGGRRLFEVLPKHVELEIVRVVDTPEATHIRYRVLR